MGDKRRILIIDDEKYLLEITKANLEESGKFEVMTLSSAKDTISYLHSFKPELILVDLLMPVVGGIEVCEMLNNDPLGQRTPIIVLSALEKDGDKFNAYKKGVVDYLTKPIEKDVLIAKIEKALEVKSNE
ncbi:MAG: response regulator [Candidatus Omnitrophica bacterium]|nr:response regulator [Candidatus Omnitrophota bacterium]MDD5166047.1 response regulator [Candidatus Omnitrophota bacterium]